jgi:ribosomal protein S18 acetylase RimI-like enzyme
MMRNPEIVLLEASQIQLASQMLGNAFHHDPLFQYFTYADDDRSDKLRQRRRQIALQWLGKMILNYAYPYQTIYTTTEAMKGVAIWIPPHKYPLNELRLLMAGAYAIPFKLRLDRLLQFMPLFHTVEVLHKAVMSQPHWYLMMLGVDPAYQNQGVGGALLQPVLAEADKENIPCYLETSTAAAVRFYQRQGFEVLETINSCPENIWIWVMKRDPQQL